MGLLTSLFHCPVPISDGGQRLIIIPGLSGNDLAVGVEQPESNEAGRQGQGLIPQQTMIGPIEIRKEQADDKIIRDSEDQRGNIQQEEEEIIGEIQKQQEDKEEKIKENLCHTSICRRTNTPQACGRQYCSAHELYSCCWLYCRR
jgi:hypothetical protein